MSRCGRERLCAHKSLRNQARPPLCGGDREAMIPKHSPVLQRGGESRQRIMAGPERPFVETRYALMFPTLTPAEIARLRRFGEVRRHAAGEQLVRTGEPSTGILVAPSGELAVSQHNVLGRSEPIVTHEPGGFMGELAQLSGRPSLVDAVATKPVEVLVIPSSRLRDVLVAEAELGERIMRALILRRVGLLEGGAGGPLIVGRADDGDVLRLAGFLARN